MAVFAENHHRNNASPLGAEKRFTNEILVDDDLLAQSFAGGALHGIPKRNIHTAVAG